jgi:hypothetical protein
VRRNTTRRHALTPPVLNIQPAESVEEFVEIDWAQVQWLLIVLAHVPRP